MNFPELPTPTLLLDKEKLLANIARMQASADRLGVQLRPHLKTLKAAKAVAALKATEDTVWVLEKDLKDEA